MANGRQWPTVDDRRCPNHHRRCSQSLCRSSVETPSDRRTSVLRLKLSVAVLPLPSRIFVDSQAHADDVGELCLVACRPVLQLPHSANLSGITNSGHSVTSCSTPNAGNGFSSSNKALYPGNGFGRSIKGSISRSCNPQNATSPSLHTSSPGHPNSSAHQVGCSTPQPQLSYQLATLLSLSSSRSNTPWQATPPTPNNYPTPCLSIAPQIGSITVLSSLRLPRTHMSASIYSCASRASTAMASNGCFRLQRSVTDGVDGRRSSMADSQRSTVSQPPPTMLSILMLIIGADSLRPTDVGPLPQTVCCRPPSPAFQDLRRFSGPRRRRQQTLISSLLNPLAKDINILQRPRRLTLSGGIIHRHNLTDCLIGGLSGMPHKAITWQNQPSPHLKAIQGFNWQNQPSPHRVSQPHQLPLAESHVATSSPRPHKLSLAESTITRLSSDCLHQRSVGHQSPAMAICVAPSLTGSPRVSPTASLDGSVESPHNVGTLDQSSDCLTRRIYRASPTPLLHLPFMLRSPSPPARLRAQAMAPAARLKAPYQAHATLRMRRRHPFTLLHPVIPILLPIRQHLQLPTTIQRPAPPLLLKLADNGAFFSVPPPNSSECLDL
eukprot:Gb_06190 [translate_table: standard]